MKKLSLILTMLMFGTSVFAASAAMTPDSDMMGPGKAFCEKHSMTPSDCKAEMAKWKNATPDQKMAMMKDHWTKMTPDEKKMAMDRMVLRYNAMDADSQKALMQMMQNGK
jgi:hypothetical protein